MEHIPPAPRPAALVGAGLVLVAAIGFSAKAIFVKLAYRYQVDPITLLALRMLMSLPFFIVAAFWSRRERAPRLDGRQWGAVVFLGVVGYYLASLFDFLGLQYVSAGLERLVLFLYPTLVVLLTVVRYRRPITSREIIALLLSYGGIAFVFLHDLQVDGGSVPLGTALVFAPGQEDCLVKSARVHALLKNTRTPLFGVPTENGLDLEALVDDPGSAKKHDHRGKVKA